MKTSTRKRAILELATVALAITTIAAYAQLTKTQDVKYALSPTMTISVTNIDLGTLQGGSSGSQTFNGVVTFQVTSSSAQTVTATLGANSTSFASLEVAITNSGGQVCDLKVVAQSASCTFTIPGSATTTYNEVVVYTTQDGISYAGFDPLTFTLA